MTNNNDVFIHPTAVVDNGATIGSHTKIWHFSHVMPKAVIGPDCSLGQNVFIANHVNIGRGVKIQNNVSVYEGVTLEDYVFCGPSMTFTNVKTPRSAFPCSSTDEYQRTIVKYGASIGANATVVCGITIGEWAFIAAGAVVTKNVPPFALIAGVPGRIKGYVCQCGTALHFNGSHTTAECPACQKTYDKIDEIITLRP